MEAQSLVPPYRCSRYYNDFAIYLLILHFSFNFLRFIKYGRFEEK